MKKSKGIIMGELEKEYNSYRKEQPFVEYLNLQCTSQWLFQWLRFVTQIFSSDAENIGTD